MEIKGIRMMMIGAWLMANDKFFQWPPYAVTFVNDDIWGVYTSDYVKSYFVDKYQTITQEQYEQIVAVKQ